jgi:hypothetical protein
MTNQTRSGDDDNCSIQSATALQKAIAAKSATDEALSCGGRNTNEREREREWRNFNSRYINATASGADLGHRRSFIAFVTSVSRAGQICRRALVNEMTVGGEARSFLSQSPTVAD